jgi:hypothetical protein
LNKTKGELDLQSGIYTSKPVIIMWKLYYDAILSNNTSTILNKRRHSCVINPSEFVIIDGDHRQAASIELKGEYKYAIYIIIL